jgi:hypothetical protein
MATSTSRDFRSALATKIGRNTSLDRSSARGKAVFPRPDNTLSVDAVFTFRCPAKVHNYHAPYFSACIVKTLRAALPESLASLRVGVHNAFNSMTPYILEHLATGLYIKLLITIPVSWLPTLQSLMRNGLFHTAFTSPHLPTPQPVGLLVCSNSGQSLFHSHRECIVTNWPSYYSALDVVNALVAVEGITGPITATPVVSRQVPDADVTGAFTLTDYSTTFPDVLELGAGRNRIEIFFSRTARHDLPFGGLVLIPLPPPPTQLSAPAQPGIAPPRPPRGDILQTPVTSVATRATPVGVTMAGTPLPPSTAAAGQTGTAVGNDVVLAPPSAAAPPPPAMATNAAYDAPADADSAAAIAATAASDLAIAITANAAVYARDATNAPATATTSSAGAPVAAGVPAPANAAGVPMAPVPTFTDAIDAMMDLGATSAGADNLSGLLHPATTAFGSKIPPSPAFLPQHDDLMPTSSAAINSGSGGSGVWLKGLAEKRKEKNNIHFEQHTTSTKKKAGPRSTSVVNNSTHLPHHD